MARWEDILYSKALPSWILGTEDISKINAEIAILSLGIGNRFRLPLPRRHGFVRIGKVKGKRVACASVPAGTVVLESLLKVISIAGIKEVIGIGAAGGLQDNITIGDIVLPDAAFSGEGLSYYYGRGRELIEADFSMIKALSRGLGDYHQGKIFTTASIVKETDEFIKELQDEGYLAIECEMAAIYLLAQELGFKTCGVLVISDHPSKKELSSNKHENLMAVRRGFEMARRVITGYISSL